MISTPLVLSAEDSHWYDPESEYHSDLDFSEMEYTGVDEDEAYAVIDELNRSVESGSDQDVIAAYDELEVMMDFLDTQKDLNIIRYYCDIYNDEYADLDSYYTEFLTEYCDRMSASIRDALNSDKGDALKAHIGNEAVINDFIDYENMDDDQKKLFSEYNELRQEYERKVMGDFHTIIDGEDWTLKRLEEEASTMSYLEYNRILTSLLDEQTRILGEIYLDIVANRNAYAAYAGYDDYANFSYENVYHRDYTTSDIAKVYDGVLEYMVPLYNDLVSRQNYNYRLENMDLSGEERLARVAPVISRIDPELQESWDYMVSHHLYEIDASDTKMDRGFTMPMYYYGAPFFFDAPYKNWNDIQTVIHEFGHFNNAYHVQRTFLSDNANMDVAEIQSQGLELLALKYAGDIYGENNAEDVRLKVLGDITEAVIYACVFDEFQYRVYTYDGTLTVDILNDIYEEVNNKYFPGDESSPMSRYRWAFNTHNFESPMYYISYGTSALAALDIYAMSTDDWQAAVDCYMNLSTYGWESGYREVLDDVGLPDVFEPENVEDIAIAIRSQINGSRSRSSTLAIVISVGVLIGALFTILIIVLIVLHSRRKNMKKREAQILGGYQQMQQMPPGFGQQSQQIPPGYVQQVQQIGEKK